MLACLHGSHRKYIKLVGLPMPSLLSYLCLYCFRFFDRERCNLSRLSPNAGESSKFEAFLVSFVKVSFLDCLLAASLALTLLKSKPLASRSLSSRSRKSPFLTDPFTLLTRVLLTVPWNWTLTGRLSPHKSFFTWLSQGQRARFHLSQLSYLETFLDSNLWNRCLACCVYYCLVLL